MLSLNVKNLIYLCLLALWFAFPKSVSSHPLDVSYLIITTAPEENVTPAPVIKSRLYLSWPQSIFLAEQNPKATKIPIVQPEKMDFMKFVTQTLTANREYYQEYFDQHILFANNLGPCTLMDFALPVQEKREILFGRGIEMITRHSCNGDLNQINLKNTLMLDEFRLQTNNISFEFSDETSQKIVLDKNKTEYTFFNIPPSPTLDPTKPITQTINKSRFLASLENKLIDISQSSPLQTILIVFILGLLHAFEAGHDKSILISFMLNKEAKIKDGLLFILVFTITHLSDIFILGSLFFVVNSFTDIYSKLPYLQKFSAYGLLFVSTIILLKNIQHLRQHKNKLSHHHHSSKQNKHTSIKKQLVLGFMTGLTPCLFGWSIFLLIVTTRNIWLIFPIMVSFGIGILISLLTIAALVNIFKIQLFGKWGKIADLSPLISSVLLVLISVATVIRFSG